MTVITDRARQYSKFVYSLIAYPLLLLTVFSLILSWRVAVMLSAASRVDQADKILSKANFAETQIVYQQSCFRGYFVNNDPDYYTRYRDATKDVTYSFGSLERSLQLLPQKEGQVQQLSLLYARWKGEADDEINFSVAYPVGYRSSFGRGGEQSMMDKLRSGFSSFITGEEEFRKGLDDDLGLAIAVTLIGTAVLAILFSVALSVVFLKQTREFADRYEEALNVSARNLNLLSATLMSIGDAVLVTDAVGKVQQMNSVAEELTGWKFSDAYGMNATAVFKIVDRISRESLESPIDRVTTGGDAIGLNDKAILLRQDGTELAIDDSCSPIRNNSGRVVGAVLIFRDVTERKRSERELARLYEREHRIAENLQRSLLSKPDPTLFPNLEIETFYQSAWAEAKVGGDYYDIVNLQNGTVALIVGDVSGKGLKAASRTAELKFTLRAYLREKPDIADAVSRLNKFICQFQNPDDDSTNFFSCMTAIVLDPATGLGHVCVCGSEPPIRINRNGQATEIEASGTPVGAFDFSAYSATEIRLEVGEILVATTDGITEARRENEFLGNNGLAEFASRVQLSRPLAQIGTFIVDEVKKYASNRLSDDICLLLVRRK
jgi:PAS domain S-box-containing protein